MNCVRSNVGWLFEVLSKENVITMAAIYLAEATQW